MKSEHCFGESGLRYAMDETCLMILAVFNRALRLRPRMERDRVDEQLSLGFKVTIFFGFPENFIFCKLKTG